MSISKTIFRTSLMSAFVVVLALDQRQHIVVWRIAPVPALARVFSPGVAAARNRPVP
jgi:hypothetical protein